MAAPVLAESRSFLFCPAHDARKTARVDDFGADAVVLDLEDAVPPHEKAGARGLARKALAGIVHAHAGVRSNGLDTGLALDDIAAVVSAGLDFVVVPKVTTPEDLATVDRHLGECEERAGLAPGSVALVPLIERVSAVLSVAELVKAAPARVPRLAFGLGDFALEAGIPVAMGEAMLTAKSLIVMASAAAGLARPVDGPYLTLADPDGLAADSARSHALGFGGRVVVHPPQVGPVNASYPLADHQALSRATRLVEEFEASIATGKAAMRFEGEFVDYPGYLAAKRLLARNH
ncbi:CoA ester lyase [Amycolatopsis sp. GM8]|uniref:HpcH/HpaI aldolase/citrate lyase family protein n=1 Tax=Amycolatopsis sp. GM8 TaxID=2896530 RepID=UPI001F3764A4|nr:CoA ester lyase [Amycolatopsis sp. GM8]